MAHLIPDFAFALLPATIVTFQSLYDKDDIIKAQTPETTFPEEAKPPVGPRFQNIKKVDPAVPLMILSGVSFGPSTALMGCAYAIGRAIYTSSKDESAIEAGKNFMTFNLVLLSVSSALSAYTLLTRKPKYFK